MRSEGMQVLVASSSFYRQICYGQQLESLGHEATVVSGGVQCVTQLRRSSYDLLVLEAPLLWGGSDGVLALAKDDPRLASLAVILICTSQGSHDWFSLSRFRVDDFLIRVPTQGELRSAIDRCRRAAPCRTTLQQTTPDHATPGHWEGFGGGATLYSSVAEALPLPAGFFRGGDLLCAASTTARS